MDDEIDPQIPSGAEAPEGEQPVAEAPEAPEAAEPTFQEGMASAIAGALKDDDDEEAPAERLRGPDGRFLAKEGEKPAEPEAQPEAVKPPEDDPYKEPEGLKDGARERFQALATRAKSREQELEQVKAEYAQQREAVTAFQQMITETGASTEEFASLLDFAKAVKQGNWQAAEPLLLGLAQQYRIATGRDLAGPTDPFAQHPDIAQAIAQQQITPQAAQELVRARAYMAQQQTAQQQAAAQQRTAQQQEQAVQTATQSVRALTAKWQQSDLDWPKKQAILQEQAKSIAHTLPADQWAFALQTAYDAITKAMVSSVPARAPVSSASPQPLRPSGASAGRREPSSMLEAISASLG